MSRHPDLARHYKTFKRSFHVTGTNCTQEIRRNFTVFFNYHKLNSIIVTYTLSPPIKDKALQVVYSRNWLSSFHLAQGYSLLVVEDTDNKKTVREQDPQASMDLLTGQLGSLIEDLALFI